MSFVILFVVLLSIVLLFVGFTFKGKDGRDNKRSNKENNFFKIVISLLLFILTAFAIYVFVIYRMKVFYNSSDSLRICSHNLRTLGKALNDYAAHSEGRYPYTLDTLVPLYIESIPHCPLKNDHSESSQYSYLLNDQNTSFTIYCKGNMHKKAQIETDFPQFSSDYGFFERSLGYPKTPQEELKLLIINNPVKAIEFLKDNPQFIKDPLEEFDPLETSVQYNQIHIVRFLMKNNAPIDMQKGAFGRTPLMTAVLRDNIDILTLLLENGAQVNIIDERGDTALHLSVLKNNLAITEILLKNNANTHIKNNQGKTPLMTAEENKYDEIRLQLIEAGAKQ